MNMKQLMKKGKIKFVMFQVGVDCNLGVDTFEEP
jgi:hypothetical protein